MKIVQESIFMNSLRAFFVSLFAGAGIVCVLFLLILGIYGLSKLSTEENFSSSVKILPDQNGHRKELSMTTPIILQLSIHGEIGKDDLTGAKVENILLKSREKEFKEDRVKGILLSINSPGGGVDDSDKIFRLIQDYKKKYNVPVFAYIDGTCASGGYYIACASDKIYASNVSLVGSVGVLSWPPFFNVVDLLKKVGVNTLTLSAGKGKDELNPTKVWREDESKNYQELLNYYYQSFVDHVVAHRPTLDKERLVNEFGARVFPAPIAKEHGYIDFSGASRSECLKELTAQAGIKEGEKYQVVGIETTEWLKKLLKEKSPLITGKVEHTLELPKELVTQQAFSFR